MTPNRRPSFLTWLMQRAIISMLLLGSATAMAQAPATAPAATASKPAPAADNKPARMLIWEVTRADQPALKAWIFGTVHVGKAEFYPLPATVSKAFSEANVLAVEADVTDQQALEQATSLMLFKPPESLVTRLPAPLVERLRNQCRRLGLPFEALQSVKPFAAAGLLVVSEYSRQGMEQAQGLDLHFIQQAKNVSKPIVELEGLVEQAKIVTSLGREDDAAFIDNAVASLESGDAGRLINRLVSAWQAGDGAKLWAMLEESSRGMERRKEIEEVLIHARNRQMAAKMEGLLKAGKKPFVAVGAAHLVGPTGLVKLLGERGYQLRQL
jgi:uncharacterized protein